MDVRAVDLHDGGAFGAAVGASFTGWHISNQAALGRTIEAIVVKSSAAGASIAAAAAAASAVPATTAEVAALVGASASRWHTPLRVRVRGPSAACATTVVDVAGLVVPTGAYAVAKSMVLDAINFRIAERARTGETLGETHASLGVVPLAAIPSVFFAPPNRGHYSRAIAAAARRGDDGAPAWKDAKSRKFNVEEITSTVDAILRLPAPP